jgi:hypothetical protein
MDLMQSVVEWVERSKTIIAERLIDGFHFVLPILQRTLPRTAPLRYSAPSAGVVQW